MLTRVSMIAFGEGTPLIFVGVKWAKVLAFIASGIYDEAYEGEAIIVCSTYASGRARNIHSIFFGKLVFVEPCSRSPPLLLMKLFG
jgi:hypothetical protein